MRRKLLQLLVRLFGRTLSYRLGRAVYMRARRDDVNDISVNGELMVQARIVEAALKAGREELCCFDVGANRGDWSLPLLDRCDALSFSGLVLYMFEPVPSTLDILRRKTGDRKNIRFEEMALSSSVGTASMQIVGPGGGTNSLHEGVAQRDVEIIQVRTSTVHQYCLNHQIKRIDLMKCDTEGHDAEVIRGALPLLREGCIAVLQFEYNHRWIFARSYLKDVFEAVQGLPYKVGKICNDHIETYPCWHFELDRFFESNYVLIREDALSWFEIRKVTFDNSNSITSET